MAVTLSRDLKRLLEHRQRQRELFEKIQRVHEKKIDVENNGGKDMNKIYEEIKSLYRDKFVMAAEELNQVTDCIGQLQRLIHKKNLQLRKKQKLSHVDQRKPKHRTRNSDMDIWFSHTHGEIPVGSEVAAHVGDHHKSRNWILAKIVSYLDGGGREDRIRYEVVGVDPVDETNPVPVRKQYCLHPNKIIRIPSLKEVPLTKRKEFSPNDRILGIYPGETILYPALVVRTPSTNKSFNYSLQFDDDDGDIRDVNAQYVTPLPEEYCNSSSEYPNYILNENHVASDSSEEGIPTKRRLPNRPELQQKQISSFFPKSPSKIKKGRSKKKNNKPTRANAATQQKLRNTHQTNEHKQKHEKKAKNRLNERSSPWKMFSSSARSKA